MGDSLSFCTSFLGVPYPACVTPTIHMDGVAMRTNAQRQPSAASAGDLHRPARATVRHEATRSRPGQGPRQRRPLQSNVGRCGDKRRGKCSENTGGMAYYERSGINSEILIFSNTTRIVARIPKYWCSRIRRAAGWLCYRLESTGKKTSNFPSPLGNLSKVPALAWVRSGSAGSRTNVVVVLGLILTM